MQVIVDKHTVTIIKNEIINEGEYNVQSCNFQFSSDYDGLPKIAIFKTDTVTKQIMLSGNTCITPEEVLQTTGIVGLGVYAYQTEGDNLTLRYSPTPAVFTVEPGSYDEGDAPTPPTPSIVEQLQEEITQNANNITSLENITSTHTSQIESIQGDITNINLEQTTQNNKISQNTSDIATLNNNLTNYSLITETGSQIVLNVNSSNYQMTAILKDKNGNTIYTSNVIDLPIESMIINVTYDSTTKEIVFTLQNGTTLRVSVADLVSGLVSTDDLNTILANYYTKTEIDTLLSTKANSNDVYTKSETDTLLGEKVDTATYTQGQATQDTNIQNNANSIEDIESLINQMPTVSAQGTNISLQDVYNYRLIKFSPQGNSSQFSTTGSNIIGLDSEQYHVNLRTYDKIVVTNETNANVVIDLFTNYGDTTRNDYWTITPAQSPRVITIEHDALAIKWHSVPNGKAWINLGETALPYEPYTGGVPSPNPSYPYMPSRVTGENTVVLQNENLCNGTSKHYFANSSGAIINAGTNAYLSIPEKIKVKPNTQYTIKFYGYESYTSGVYLAEYDRTDTFIQRTSSNLTFTTGANTYYIFVYIYNNSNPFTQIGTNIALVKGSTAPTTYVEHEEQNYSLSLGNIELNSSPDGTIRDGIVGKPNEWYKREYIGKVVLNGSESWEDRPSYQYADRFVLSTVMRDLTQNDMLINNFKYGNASSNTYPYLAKSGGQCVINFSEFGSTTLEQFKEWLATHNTIVYGTRVTPTDIPITDTTLINQLNNIYNNAHSYNGVTNITTTYEDGNEQMYLDIEALAKSATETDPTVPSYVKEITQQNITDWNDKQDELVSGTSIKTINNESILGSGNIEIQGGGTSYTAGTNIEITNENVINNTIPFEKNSDGLIFGEKKVNTSLNTNTVAVGKNVTASGIQTVSIGNNSKASSQFAISIGPYSAVDVDCGIAIGRNAQSHGANSIVIGESAVTYQSSSIALGREANARQSNLFQIGSYNYPINKVQVTTSNGDKELATTDFLTTITGYDAAKTQVLKNVNGTMTWVDE